MRGILDQAYLDLTPLMPMNLWHELVPTLWTLINRSEWEEGHYSPLRDEKEKLKKTNPIIRVLENQKWETKGEQKFSVPTELTKQFHPLVIFLKECGLLSEIGRIKIFLSPPFSHTPFHYDHNDYYLKNELPLHRHEFIWLSSGPEKRFMIGEHSVKSQAVFFNECDLHGTQASPSWSFAVKADGKFDRKRFENAGIKLPDQF